MVTEFVEKLVQNDFFFFGMFYENENFGTNLRRW